MSESVENWIIKVIEESSESEPESNEHFRDRPRKSHHPAKEEKGPHAGRVTRPTHPQPDNRSRVSYRDHAGSRVTTRPNSDDVAQASCARTEARHRGEAQQQQHAPAPPPARYDTKMSALNAPDLNHYPEPEFPQNPLQLLQHHLPQNQQHPQHSDYSYNMTFGRNGEYQVQIDYRITPNSVALQHTSSGGSHSGTEHQGNLNVIFGDCPGNLTLNVAGRPPLHLSLAQHSSFGNPPPRPPQQLPSLPPPNPPSNSPSNLLLLPSFNTLQKQPPQLPSLPPPSPSPNPPSSPPLLLLFNTLQREPQYPPPNPPPNPSTNPPQNLPPPPPSPHHPNTENQPLRPPVEAAPRPQQRQSEPQTPSAPAFPHPQPSGSQTKEKKRQREKTCREERRREDKRRENKRREDKRREERHKEERKRLRHRRSK
ncbi:hypothetical protein EYC80_007767 [Monilinia laxa]|uniref:Uncharacterized protein n=1 Tax=Monilinia laxa TaxID=61186 RepID=A0A5N6JX44_MONLA|nr:hypothetical protein EYC80_007767 [Monilinia laxa]